MSNPTCPKCKEHPLSTLDGRTPAPGNINASLRCTSCKGTWVSGHDLQEQRIVADDAPTPAEEDHGREVDHTGGMCPYGHRLLIRARIPLEPPFYLDKCPECRGVFFDAGELRRVQSASLLSDLSRYWDKLVQRQIDAAEFERMQHDRMIEIFGEQGLLTLEAAAKVIAESPHPNMGIAFIAEKSGLLGHLTVAPE